jgi:serine/threonine protein kinase
MNRAENWITIEESGFPWEREALAFVRDQFPRQEPYRAWSNFEFIATDGTINEVDLLVFTMQGCFLVEIKSRPGRIYGDAGTWVWETDGKRRTYDNPIRLANLKAKKLRSLLSRQRAGRSNTQVPFIEPLVFCSAPNQISELQGEASYGVCLRDQAAIDQTPERPGIMAALLSRQCPGLRKYPTGDFDRLTSKMVAQALEQAGIRPSQKHRKVSDYELEKVLEHGRGFQDWQATHTQLENSRRRIRLYVTRTESSDDDRQTIERAAKREFAILEDLQHPNVLRTYGYTTHEIGPALLFEHDDRAMRLDHYLTQYKDTLGTEKRLQILRQLGEVVSFIHDKRVIHRGLSPQSILVSETKQGYPAVKVINWQMAYRAGSSSGVQEITATSHVDRLVEDVSAVYLAPELSIDEGIVGEHLDIFSLGAIAYSLFSGEAPATNVLELSNKLREHRGLQISAVLNGAPESLQSLIQDSTRPVIDDRMETVAEFIQALDVVEADLRAIELNEVTNPNEAQQGDRLPGGLTVIKRLGQGACAIALLVEREGEEFVLKVANDVEHNRRIKEEIEVTSKLHAHQHIVKFWKEVEIGDRVGFLMEPVLLDRDKRLVETLGHRLRQEGRLHLDLLQRFGEDLLDVVRYLEEQGVSHRDIKPDNIAVGQVGAGSKLHLVLFDFSLAKTPIDNIRAGTSGYLDPLLRDRKPACWDSYAERYAAAITLYELTTGTLPKWGDGLSDPFQLKCEITIESELFDANLREDLTAFFQKAFRRKIKQRFDNAESMLRSWRACFDSLEPNTLSDHADDPDVEAKLEQAELGTNLVELGLGTRVINVLDRINVMTVQDLLSVPMAQLSGLRGVGNATRREITKIAKLLRDRLGAVTSDGGFDNDAEVQSAGSDPARLNVGALSHRASHILARESADVHRLILGCLGLGAAAANPWLSQSELADGLGQSRDFVGQWMEKIRGRWTKEPAVTRLRNDVAAILQRASGVMSVQELADAVLLDRGSSEVEPLRSRQAMAMVRVVVEVEGTMGLPRFGLHRFKSDAPGPGTQRLLVSVDAGLARYAIALGDVADQLAQADPLVSPSRAMAQLQAVVQPEVVRSEVAASAIGELTDWTETRLFRLAEVASRQSALSSRQEFYPKGMAVERLLRLAQGTLYGVRTLTIEQIQDRLMSRYPSAAVLPGRPQLDELLREVGLDLVWSSEERLYVNRGLEPESSLASSSMMTTGQPRGMAGELTPDVADARQFEERLRRGLKEGSYQVLLVEQRRYVAAIEQLRLRFAIEVVDFEAEFLVALRQVSDRAGVNWELVVRTDRVPGQGDWDKLMMLVGRSMPIVEQRLLAASKTILLVYPGLLARYAQMGLLERLRDNLGRADGVPGLWVLVPDENRAMIHDGRGTEQAVPVLSPGQRVRVPEQWIRS